MIAALNRRILTPSTVRVVNEGWLYHAHLLPYMAAQHPEVLSPSQWYSADGPLGPIANVVLFHTFAQIGQLLLAIATMRAGVLPRRPAQFLAIGQAALLVFLVTPDEIDHLLLPVIAVLMLGIVVSYAWFGWTLLRSERAPTTQIAAVSA